ncbi:putative calcium-binding protein CML19 [Bidens hawaiensis]|uniref:putative calcium-binding protein CML19 n=1 Tax=Bidens hawaiensis TaxID=980011 RepID=UPI00404B7FBB
MNKSPTDYKRVFDRFDEDHNGMISPSELQCCFRLIHNDEILVEEVEDVINGQLVFEDFINLMESSKEDEKVEDLKKAFGMYEMEGTDCITPKSLKRMLSRLGEPTSFDECVGMIHEFDIDGDGVLNFDEFKAMIVC